LSFGISSTLFYAHARPKQTAEASVTERRARQIDLFQDSDPPRGIPAAIEQEVLELLVQLVQSMIPIVEAEAADEQDLD
jgi:hypothetical protein